MAYQTNTQYHPQYPSAATGGSVPVDNNLTTSSPTDALSAAQGVALQAEIVADQQAIAALQAQIPKGNDPHALTVTTAGQTYLQLPSAPTDPASIAIAVDGVFYTPAGGDFSLSGTTVTWTNTTVALQPTDTVVAYYK